MDIMHMEQSYTMPAPAQPQDYYVERLPSPPRISILPPKDDASPRLPAHFYAPHGIFSHVDFSPRAFPLATWGDWSYNKRRTAQAVLPFMYVGPLSVVKDIDFICHQQIKFVIYARHNRPDQHTVSGPLPPVLTAAAANIQGLSTHVLDISSTADLASSFSSINDMITRHFTTNNVRAMGMCNAWQSARVLICCESGNERSAALAIAYIMEITDLGLVEACQLVQNQRFAVNIDDTMKWSLQQFEDCLRAKRQVQNAQDANEAAMKSNVRQSILCNIYASRPASWDMMATSGARRSSTKRALEDDDDDMDDRAAGGDDEMRDADDDTPRMHDTNGYPSGRRFAPFSSAG